MTLVVAVATESGVWIGGDRFAGDFNWVELAGPKVFELTTEDDHPFGVGLSGVPRTAQAILAVVPPARLPGSRSLHWWLTTYCDRIHEHLRDHGLMRDDSNEDPVYTAGDTGMVLGIEGRVFLISPTLSWEETTSGYIANGGARDTFTGAYEVLAEQMGDPVAAARAAWPYAQRRHRIGPLADQLLVGSSPA